MNSVLRFKDSCTTLWITSVNGNGRQAAECISNIFALVEDAGQEMLDKQAAEKLEDIIELASNALRELNNRLD